MRVLPGASFIQVTGLNTPLTVVGIVGELNSSTAPLLAKGIATALGTSPQDLIVDLSETSFFGSAGVGVILSVRKYLREDARVILRKPQPFIRKMLDASRLDTVCVVED